MLTDAELMAIKVLKGDFGAARALADYLGEMYSRGAMEVPPVTKITEASDRIGVVVFYPAETPDLVFDFERIAADVKNWINNPGTDLVLFGAIAFQVYEFPEKK